MKNLSIHRKLFLQYIFLSLIPTILLGFFMGSNIKKITLNRALSDAQQNVDMIHSEFSRSLNVSINVSKQLYLSQNFFSLIEKKYESTWDVVDSYFAFTDFEDFRKIYINDIDDIRIFVSNDTVLENWYLNIIDDMVENSEWYKKALESPSKVLWYPTENTKTFSHKRNCYSLVRLIGDADQQAVLIIDLNREYINRLLKIEYFDTVIFDSNGNVVCTNDTKESDRITQAYSFDVYPFSTGTDVLDSEDEDGRRKVIISDFVIEGVNGRFRLVSSFSLSDILREPNALFLQYMIITVLLMLLISVFITIFSRRIRQRVSILGREMEQVSKGDFNLVSSISGGDEIGLISQRLNVMAKNLKYVVQENYESNYQKQRLTIKYNDIKLRLLTNQMNPHFLFNTLESIRMEAHIRNEMDISDIIQRLGDLLRKSIHGVNEEQPLSEELKLVEDYLYIQIFRYGDRIDYSFTVSDEAKRMKILPFLIQPIVENAITHGLESREENGIINIIAYCDDNSLCIEVIDNGSGMSDSQLRDILNSIDDDEAFGHHIGVRNVHMRIQLHYGSQYGLSIESKRDMYTKVSIRIPKEEMFGELA